jgi:hypothetical protein
MIMSSMSKFDTIVERIIEQKIEQRVEQKIEEYFASISVLSKGPVFQVHSAMTQNGLTKSALKTKRSKLANMKKNERIFVPTLRGVTMERWHSRWNATRQSMQRKTGYKWRLNNDREGGGLWITRTV